MRIAFVIDTVEPFYYGGYEKRAFELARRLARVHDVTMLTSAPAKVLVDGIRIVPLRPRVKTFNESGYRRVGEALRFAGSVAMHALRRNRFDIVDCNGTPFLHLPSAWLLAHRSHAIFIVTVHEALLDQLAEYLRQRRIPGPQLASLPLKFGYKKLHLLPDGIIASAEEAARGLESEGITVAGVTRGGVGWLGRPRARYMGRLVASARLVPPKRLTVTIEAFALASSRGHARLLTIIGDGPDRSRLEALIRHLGLDDLVRIVTGASELEKKRLLSQEADAYVSASLREGLSIATLESLGAGLPAIISSQPSRSVNGALAYITEGENGLITDGTAVSLADAITRLAAEPETFRRLSKGAIQTAESYTWDVAASELEAIYRRVASHATRRTPNT